MADFFWASCVIPMAFLMDICLGDPRGLPHPIRWMGRAIVFFEPVFRRAPFGLVFSGGLFAAFLTASAWLVAWGFLAMAGAVHPGVKTALEIVLIYYCLSAASLANAALEIKDALNAGDTGLARKRLALVVGRDVTHYQAGDISRAAVETVSENLVDGVVAPLFFAALGGAPLAAAYKMANTLDSMVGYRNDRYMEFGRISARLDDLLNFLPARLSLPFIAASVQTLMGRNGARSFKTAVLEARRHSSPNAGYPEAAFAGGLGIRLGGADRYGGRLLKKPHFGEKFPGPSPAHIPMACDIMLLSSFFLAVFSWALSWAPGLFFGAT
ncbi:Cobalamin biosynthesis protein CobD [Candidatus Desulfarcum epimagneticum]|uniref:Cobalamin biosynthesis protein CobD n=1 Tax=uncultured Desulfobacteraceae bacterium TaxID=218296 RepID=A0A484HGG8_9BACT|nr:Cobalamin biosynthesis protein CobD [uncultured Desulfobacteraceae bacterium]